MSTVDLPDGSNHCIHGVGSITIPIGTEAIHLNNVQLIPSLHTPLLSFDQLEQQGFQITLTNEKPYRFHIISPNGVRFYASRSPGSGVFDLITPIEKAEAGVANAVVDADETNQTNPARTKRPPPAPMDVWHHCYCHMNQHDLLYLHWIG